MILKEECNKALTNPIDPCVVTLYNPSILGNPGNMCNFCGRVF